MAHGMVNPGIILLKEGSDDSQGLEQILSNISACLCVVDAVRTTLGPKGMDKIVVDQNGAVTISNDGATILSKLELVHPAAQILASIARAQDSEVGDGTTSVVVLAGELLKTARPFLEDGLSPNIIARGFTTAAAKAITIVKNASLSTKIGEFSSKEGIEFLRQCAKVSMSSKLIAPYKDLFSDIVVKAVMTLDCKINLRMVGIKKISGGTLKESRLVSGVAFKKTFSYAGFEMQPKKYERPKIALLNIELELKAERTNAEIRISSVKEYQRIVDAEWKILYDKLDMIVKSGAKIVLSRLVIGDVATQYFADRDIFCAGRVTEEDMERLVLSCGGSVLSVLDVIREQDLGFCSLFEEIQEGEERFNVFIDGAVNKSCTIVLRGCGEQFLEEVERALHDALMVVKKAIQFKSVVGGAGAIEMNVSRLLKEFALTVTNKEQLVVAAFARALEIIPRQLCQNAGIDSSYMLNSLRTEHSKGHMWTGVDLDKDCVRDTLKDCLWEPTLIKVNEIASATEAACIILTADETIKNAKRDSSVAQQ